MTGLGELSMKLLYVSAWVLIIGFLVWSGNLLLQIQSLASETRELHRLSLHIDSLTGSWRDLNRPGNDVLEHYEVAQQRVALAMYKQRYAAIYDAVQRRVQGDSALAPLIAALEPIRNTLGELAENILDLAEQREALRVAQAEAEIISDRETAAARTMARMDQTFQSGLDMLLQASTVVITQERGLEELQNDNFQRLYVMLLVMLLVSALTLELIRHSMRQRAALRDGSLRINTIVNSVVDGIVTVDADGAIESINHSAERMFRYRESEVVGREFAVLLEERCRSTYRDQMSSSSVGQVIRSFSCDECDGGLGQRQDGSTFPIELTISQVTVKGRLLLIHIVRDVSERKQADQKQRLAASVFENASEGIVVTDVDGTIQSVNPAYASITQYRIEELLGQNPRLLKSERQDREFYERMWAAIRSSGHWQGEIWNRRKNGELFPQWLTINAIRDTRGRTTNYVGVVWDISELKATQRMREEFITTVSHELRTPLTSVLGSLGMIMEHSIQQLPEQAQRLVALAHSNSRRLVRLISDILDIEKIEAGSMTFQFEPLDLKALVCRVVDDSKALAVHSQITLLFRSDADQAWVNGDADRLMQAVSNLLANAIRFSPSDKPVEVAVIDDGAVIRVEVTDHGPGIPAEFRDQVFKKFTQAGGGRTSQKAGTGLGLSIAKLIVQHHGGSIDFRSTPGERTTFRIDLPRLEAGSIDPQPEVVHAPTDQRRVARS
jgi:PAS domain S-box-containing protein